jgi:hypothetical protein
LTHWVAAFVRRWLPFSRRDTRCCAFLSALGLAVVAWVLHDPPVRRDEEHHEAHVDAGLFAGEPQRLGRHLSTRAADLPPIGLAREGDGLERALHWPELAHRETPDLREHQEADVQPGAVAILFCR